WPAIPRPAFGPSPFTRRRVSTSCSSSWRPRRCLTTWPGRPPRGPAPTSPPRSRRRSAARRRHVPPRTRDRAGGTAGHARRRALIPVRADVLLVGAGPIGLGAAWRLEELGHRDWWLCEAEACAGGLASSVTDEHGFTW